jgi:hypothetical protein
MSSLKELLNRQLKSDPYSCHPGSRAALSLLVNWPGEAKDCVLPYIHLLFIKRRDREIVLRYTAAEVRIRADSEELCSKLVEEFSELRIQQIRHGGPLKVSVAFAAMEQEFEEF